MRNILLTLLTFLIPLAACNRLNNSKKDYPAETKEFLFSVDSNLNAVLTITRKVNYSLNNKSGKEEINLSIRSVSGLIDSLYFRYKLYNNNQLFFSDSLKIYQLDTDRNIDTLLLTNYLNTIDIYNAVCEVIKVNQKIEGTYAGFVKIEKDNISYFKQFTADITSTAVTTTIDGDSSIGFTATIINDSLLGGKFVFTNDTLDIDFGKSKFKVLNNNLMMNICLLPNGDSSHHQFTYSFNGTK